MSSIEFTYIPSSAETFKFIRTYTRAQAHCIYIPKLNIQTFKSTVTYAMYVQY